MIYDFENTVPGFVQAQKCHNSAKISECLKKEQKTKLNNHPFINEYYVNNNNNFTYYHDYIIIKTYFIH